MGFRTISSFGISALFLCALPATAHPAHETGRCMPGTSGEYCVPMPVEKVYEVGGELPDGYRELAEWGRFGLDAPPEGQAYSIIDGDIVLYDTSSMVILKLVKVLDTSF